MCLGVHDEDFDIIYLDNISQPIGRDEPVQCMYRSYTRVADTHSVIQKDHTSKKRKFVNVLTVRICELLHQNEEQRKYQLCFFLYFGLSLMHFCCVTFTDCHFDTRISVVLTDYDLYVAIPVLTLENTFENGI